MRKKRSGEERRERKDRRERGEESLITSGECTIILNCDQVRAPEKLDMINIDGEGRRGKRRG